MNKPEPIIHRGRPREFCVDHALTEALRVFWQKGYEGTSLTDLTEAMGITRPSLYAAFGNKESLFRKALDLYEREKLAYIGQALEQPTARKVAEFMMRGALENATGGDGGPHGCLRVTTAAVCGEGAESIRCEIMERTKSGKDSLIARFKRAQDEGDLRADIDPEGLTRVLVAYLQGLSIQASMGDTREDLEKLVEAALAIWPSR
jgi:AcrR family transcriptional regulator